MYKTDALKSLLLKINPYLDIQTDCVKVTEENIVDLLGTIRSSAKRSIGRKQKRCWSMVCWNISRKKKLVSATGMAGYGGNNTIRTKRLMKNFYLCGDGVTEPEYGNGLMAPRVAICAAHEANMITRLILGEEEI